VTDPQSLNLYSYVHNSPTGLVDRDGHMACLLSAATAGASCEDLSESGSPQKSNRAQKTREKRQKIARTAKKYSGNTDWAFKKKKDNFPCDRNKCNKFVYDVTKEAGAEAIITGRDGKPRPPLAGEWADRKTGIAHWRVLGNDETPEPGDVAAYKLSGGGTSYTGHSRIVTEVDSDGVVHGMAAHHDVVGPDDKFDRSITPTVVYRRYTGDE